MCVCVCVRHERKVWKGRERFGSYVYKLRGMDISYPVIDDDVGHMNDNA